MRKIDGEWTELTAGLKCRFVWSFGNGDWRWDEEDGHCHLMSEIDGEWIELTEGLKCIYVSPNYNGSWEYRIEEGGEMHTVKKGELPC